MEETKDKTLNYTGEEHLDFHDVPYEGDRRITGMVKMTIISISSRMMRILKSVPSM